jgi:hypothetical protein
MKVAISNSEPRTQVIIAIELLEGLNQASGGMEQLSMHRRDPRYLLMRDGLAAAKALCIHNLPRSIRRGKRIKKNILVK